MWDIKTKRVAYITYEAGFYPNHVGYKGVNQRCVVKMYIGFIRTMWDIKYIIGKQPRGAGDVLSEPCGI